MSGIITFVIGVVIGLVTICAFFNLWEWINKPKKWSRNKDFNINSFRVLLEKEVGFDNLKVRAQTDLTLEFDFFRDYNFVLTNVQGGDNFILMAKDRLSGRENDAQIIFRFDTTVDRETVDKDLLRIIYDFADGFHDVDKNSPI